MLGMRTCVGGQMACSGMSGKGHSGRIHNGIGFMDGTH